MVDRISHLDLPSPVNESANNYVGRRWRRSRCCCVAVDFVVVVRSAKTRRKIRPRSRMGFCLRNCFLHVTFHHVILMRSWLNHQSETVSLLDFCCCCFCFDIVLDERFVERLVVLLLISCMTRAILYLPCAMFVCDLGRVHAKNSIYNESFGR